VIKNKGLGTRETISAFFESRLSKCRHCTLKQQYMSNPNSANIREGKGHGRQVIFFVENKRAANFTDWVKRK